MGTLTAADDKPLFSALASSSTRHRWKRRNLSSTNRDSKFSASSSRRSRKHQHRHEHLTVNLTDGSKVVVGRLWLLEWIDDLRIIPSGMMTPQLRDLLQSIPVDRPYAITEDHVESLLTCLPAREVLRFKQKVAITVFHNAAVSCFNNDHIDFAVEHAFKRFQDDWEIPGPDVGTAPSTAQGRDRGSDDVDQKPQTPAWNFVMLQFDREMEAASKIQRAFRAFKARCEKAGWPSGAPPLGSESQDDQAPDAAAKPRYMDFLKGKAGADTSHSLRSSHANGSSNGGRVGSLTGSTRGIGNPAHGMNHNVKGVPIPTQRTKSELKAAITKKLLERMKKKIAQAQAAGEAQPTAAAVVEHVISITGPGQVTTATTTPAPPHATDASSSNDQPENSGSVGLTGVSHHPGVNAPPNTALPGASWSIKALSKSTRAFLTMTEEQLLSLAEEHAEKLARQTMKDRKAAVKAAAKVERAMLREEAREKRRDARKAVKQQRREVIVRSKLARAYLRKIAAIREMLANRPSNTNEVAATAGQVNDSTQQEGGTAGQEGDASHRSSESDDSTGTAQTEASDSNGIDVNSNPWSNLTEAKLKGMETAVAETLLSQQDTKTRQHIKILKTYHKKYVRKRRSTGGSQAGKKKKKSSTSRAGSRASSSMATRASTATGVSRRASEMGFQKSRFDDAVSATTPRSRRGSVCGAGPDKLDSPRRRESYSGGTLLSPRVAALMQVQKSQSRRFSMNGALPVLPLADLRKKQQRADDGSADGGSQGYPLSSRSAPKSAMATPRSDGDAENSARARRASFYGVAPADDDADDDPDGVLAVGIASPRMGMTSGNNDDFVNVSSRSSVRRRSAPGSSSASAVTGLYSGPNLAPRASTSMSMYSSQSAYDESGNPEQILNDIKFGDPVYSIPVIPKLCTQERQDRWQKLMQDIDAFEDYLSSDDEYDNDNDQEDLYASNISTDYSSDSSTITSSSSSSSSSGYGTDSDGEDTRRGSTAFALSAASTMESKREPALFSSDLAMPAVALSFAGHVKQKALPIGSVGHPAALQQDNSGASDDQPLILHESSESVAVRQEAGEKAWPMTGKLLEAAGKERDVGRSAEVVVLPDGRKVKASLVGLAEESDTARKAIMAGEALLDPTHFYNLNQQIKMTKIKNLTAKGAQPDAAATGNTSDRGRNASNAGDGTNRSNNSKGGADKDTTRAAVRRSGNAQIASVVGKRNRRKHKGWGYGEAELNKMFFSNGLELLGDVANAASPEARLELIRKQASRMVAARMAGKHADLARPVSADACNTAIHEFDNDESDQPSELHDGLSDYHDDDDVVTDMHGEHVVSTAPAGARRKISIHGALTGAAMQACLYKPGQLRKRDSKPDHDNAYGLHSDLIRAKSTSPVPFKSKSPTPQLRSRLSHPHTTTSSRTSSPVESEHSMIQPRSSHGTGSAGALPNLVSRRSVTSPGPSSRLGHVSPIPGKHPYHPSYHSTHLVERLSKPYLHSDEQQRDSACDDDGLDSDSANDHPNGAFHSSFEDGAPFAQSVFMHGPDRDSHVTQHDHATSTYGEQVAKGSRQSPIAAGRASPSAMPKTSPATEARLYNSQTVYPDYEAAQAWMSSHQHHNQHRFGGGQTGRFAGAVYQRYLVDGTLTRASTADVLSLKQRAQLQETHSRKSSDLMPAGVAAHDEGVSQEECQNVEGQSYALYGKIAQSPDKGNSTMRNFTAEGADAITRRLLHIQRQGYALDNKHPAGLDADVALFDASCQPQLPASQTRKSRLIQGRFNLATPAAPSVATPVPATPQGLQASRSEVHAGNVGQKAASGASCVKVCMPRSWPGKQQRVFNFKAATTRKQQDVMQQDSSVILQNKPVLGMSTPAAAHAQLQHQVGQGQHSHKDHHSNSDIDQRLAESASHATCCGVTSDRMMTVPPIASMGHAAEYLAAPQLATARKAAAPALTSQPHASQTAVNGHDVLHTHNRISQHIHLSPDPDAEVQEVQALATRSRRVSPTPFADPSQLQEHSPLVKASMVEDHSEVTAQHSVVAASPSATGNDALAGLQKSTMPPHAARNHAHGNAVSALPPELKALFSSTSGIAAIHATASVPLGRNDALIGMTSAEMMRVNLTSPETVPVFDDLSRWMAMSPRSQQHHIVNKKDLAHAAERVNSNNDLRLQPLSSPRGSKQAHAASVASEDATTAETVDSMGHSGRPFASSPSGQQQDAGFARAEIAGIAEFNRQAGGCSSASAAKDHDVHAVGQGGSNHVSVNTVCELSHDDAVACVADRIQLSRVVSQSPAANSEQADLQLFGAANVATEVVVNCNVSETVHLQAAAGHVQGGDVLCTNAASSSSLVAAANDAKVAQSRSVDSRQMRKQKQQRTQERRLQHVDSWLNQVSPVMENSSFSSSSSSDATEGHVPQLSLKLPCLQACTNAAAAARAQTAPIISSSRLQDTGPTATQPAAKPKPAANACFIKDHPVSKAAASCKSQRYQTGGFKKLPPSVAIAREQPWNKEAWRTAYLQEDSPAMAAYMDMLRMLGYLTPSSSPEQAPNNDSKFLPALA